MSPVTYLIHLETRLGSNHPNGSAGHYLGQTVNLNRRIQQHRDGTGARILAAAVSRGISFEVVRTWEGGRETERRLKAHHNAPRMCPRCS